MSDDTLQQGWIGNTSTYLKPCKYSGKGVLLLLLFLWEWIPTEMETFEMKQKCMTGERRHISDIWG